MSPRDGDGRRVGLMGSGRVLAASLIVLLAAASTWYFGTEALEGIEQYEGKACFYRNDLAGALRHYESARRHGGGGPEIDRDEIDALLFGADQADLKIKTNLPLSADAAAVRAREILAALIKFRPASAYSWSIASDLYMRDARQRDKVVPLDLSTLSDDPLENLSRERWLGIASLRIASSIEPNNYLYYLLRVDTFLDAGSAEKAAADCRRAVTALPNLQAHDYLTRADLPGEVVEAAVRGFEDALGRVSLVPRVRVLYELALFLIENKQDERAAPYLLMALDEVPRSLVANFYLGQIEYRRERFEEAVRRFELVSRLAPEDAWAHFWLAKAYEGKGDLARAIDAMASARQDDPGEVRFFHALAALLEKAGRIPDAERQYVAATSYHPGDASTWAALIDFYARQGNGQSVRATCDRLQDLPSGGAVYSRLCAVPRGVTR